MCKLMILIIFHHNQISQVYMSHKNFLISSQETTATGYVRGGINLYVSILWSVDEQWRHSTMMKFMPEFFKKHYSGMAYVPIR